MRPGTDEHGGVPPHGRDMTQQVVGLTLNYRDAQRTVRCIRSLLADGARHVLVWDNSDDAGCSAAEIAASIADPRVSVVVAAANLGFAAGVNRALAWIGARHRDARVMLLNNDAELYGGALSALGAALDAVPEAVLAYPRIAQAHGSTGTVYYQPHLALLTRRRWPLSVPHASGCALLFDPSRLPLPLFDEAFFMYGEDAELGLRLAAGGRTMAHVACELVRHDGSASSGVGSEFYEARMVAAHCILARRIARSRLTYAWLIGLRALVLPARALLRASRQRSLQPLRALRDGWRLARGDDPALCRAQVSQAASSAESNAATTAAQLTASTQRNAPDGARR